MNTKYKIGYFKKDVVSGQFEDTTASSNDILEGATAYIKKDDGKAEKITGTIQKFTLSEDSLETETITLREFLNLTQSADYLFKNYKGNNIPLSYNDTENVISFNGTFQGTDIEEIPEINTDNAQSMNNMYLNSTASLIGRRKNTVSTYRALKRNKSRIEEFVEEIGYLDEWNSINWNEITIPENINSVIGLVSGCENIENLKIINNSKKLNKFFLNNLSGNVKIKSFWFTDCSKFVNGDGIDNIIYGCANLENLFLQNVKNNTFINNLSSGTPNSKLKNVYIDGLEKFDDAYGLFARSLNLENVKLLDCKNIESIFNITSNNKDNNLKTFVLNNSHAKNISIKKFDKYIDKTIVPNKTYEIPYLNYFEPETILYSTANKRYYVVKKNLNGEYYKERIVGKIDDYIKNVLNGENKAPIIKVNQSLKNLNSNLMKVFKESLDCFQKGAIIYSIIDEKYYIKDLITDDWVETYEPLEYPLKQSESLLKDMSYSFINCKKLESLKIDDASHIGELLQESFWGGGYTSTKQEYPYTYIQAKSYDENGVKVSDLLTNSDKLKYFEIGNIIYWIDDKKYYQIYEDENGDYLTKEISINEYLANNDNVPILKVNQNIETPTNNFKSTLKHFEVPSTVIYTTYQNNYSFFQFPTNGFGTWNKKEQRLGNIDNCFQNCESLKTLVLPGISISFDISASTVFEEDDIKMIFENLGKINSTESIKLNNKYSDLPQNIKNIAIDKGWTIEF